MARPISRAINWLRRRTMSSGIPNEEAVQLARRCVPLLHSKGLSKVETIESVTTRNLLGLWTGMGSVDEVIVKGSDGASCSFVVKSVGSYKKLEDDELALVDHMSYYNEATFYESDLADRMCRSGSLCPLPLCVDRTDDGDLAICMTKLPGGRFGRTADQTSAALSWLARLHGLFWGSRADEAVAAAGISDASCFWHLDRRHIELGRMQANSPLRLAAVGIDARLKADRMQTICHGDPKGANIMWDKDDGVSFYDFQWLGKGPPSKDLAYFIGINGSGIHSEEAEDALLREYHGELCRALAARGDAPPDFGCLKDSYHIAMADLGRWMTGGFKFGNTGLIFGHVKALLKSLAGEGAPSTEEGYRERLFELYPP